MQLEHAEDRTLQGPTGGRERATIRAILPGGRDVGVAQAIDMDLTPVEGMPSHVERFEPEPVRRGQWAMAVVLLSLAVVLVVLAATIL